MVTGETRASGRYRLDDVLGTGGFATVYRAHDTVLDRPVALKVMHPHLAREPRLRERFVREARALARVRHPNVVQVYDTGEDGGLVYLAMELVEGGALDGTLAEKGPLSVPEAVRIARETADALASLHARGLVHRDVKPANILVEHGGGRVVLGDLGLARPHDLDVPQTTEAIYGTPGFLAPEQIQPGAHADQRTDVYQLGATIYALLTGSPPFTGPTSSVLYAVVHEAAPDPRTLRPDLPAHIAETLLSALAKDPDERPPNPGAFSAALAAPIAPPIVAESVPVLVGRTERIERATVDVGAHPSLEAERTRAIVPPAVPFKRPARRRGWMAPAAGVAVALGVASVVGAVMLRDRGSTGTGEAVARSTPIPAQAAAVTTIATVATTVTPSAIPTATPSPPPTPTPEPATPSPTPAPTAPPATPTPTPPPTPTPASGVSVASLPSAPTAAPVSDSGSSPIRAVMAQRGYTPVGDVVASLPATDGGIVRAQRGAGCGSQGCGDLVFIQWNDRFLGTDAPVTSRSILSIAPSGPGQFTVTYGDEAGRAVPVVYTCNASRCIRSAVPPGQSPSG